MFQKLRPLGDRVLVKRKESESKTESGLYIPDSAQEKAQLGSVVSVGQGRLNNDGSRAAVQVAVGDLIYFGKYSGTEAGADYLIIREEEILGVVEEK